jgi:hypothetical protein
MTVPEIAYSNCGLYLKETPPTDYMAITGFDYIKNLSHGLTQVLSESLDIANKVVNILAPTDEIILNSAMSIFNIMYDLRGGSEISEFLKDNAFLIPLVSEAYEKLQKHFPYSTFFMSVDQDTLVISVGTTLSPEEANENLNRFDEEWWLNVCVNSQAKLCIMVEFQ